MKYRINAVKYSHFSLLFFLLLFTIFFLFSTSMGVKNAWKFIKKANPKSSKLSTLHELQNHGTMIHVDLLGSYYNTFTKYFSPHKKDFKSNRDSCLSILQELSLHLNKKKCILFLNGYDIPLDNCDGIEKKEQRNELNKQKVIDLIKKLEASNHKFDIIKYSQVKKIEWLLKKTVTVTNEMKQCFLQASTEQGWNTVIAPGRAVIAIARVANGETTVVSNNSDVIFYSGVASVITLSHGKFECYNISDILASLKISSAALTALAIVSGNDFDKNATGYEISANHKWVLKSKNFTLELKGVFITTKDYLDEYIAYLKYICVLPPVDNCYLDSYMIFVLLFETLKDNDLSGEHNDFEDILQTWKSKNKAKRYVNYFTLRQILKITVLIFSPQQLPPNQERKLIISLPLERA